MTEAARRGPVVVGYDGTASGEDAVALGRWCARLLGVATTVAVVHPSPAAISSARVDAEWIADRHRAAEAVLDRARGLLAAATDEVDFRVVASSSSAHGLHDLAEELSASLIAVGSRATGAHERLFAGSTADRLLSGSVCPVAVAPAGLRDRDLGPPDRVGVAYIDTSDARAALAFAATLALRADAALRLYTVVAAEAEVMPMFVADAEHAFSATARESYQRGLD